MRLRNISTVAIRDFLAVVRTKGFVIGLLFMPGMILVSSQLPRLLARFGASGERRFAVADFTGKLVAPLAEKLAAKNGEPGRNLTIALDFTDVPAGGPSGETYDLVRDALAGEFGERVRRKELFGYVIIGPRALEIPPARSAAGSTPNEEAEVDYGAVSLTSGDLKSAMRDVISEAVRGERLAGVGVDPSLAGRIDRRVEMREFLVSKEGKKGGVRSSGLQEALAPIALVVLLLMGVMQSAGLLLTSTIEEKSNRVVEVLISSISPFELLAGKVLGAWLTGLVMLLAWGGAGAYAAGQFDVLRSGLVHPLNLVWYIYFFLAGYLLFASLYAAIGAMCSSIQDAQTMMLPVVILIMIPMFSLMFVIEQPDSGLSRVLTWFPFTAPFIAVLRLALSPPAAQWEIALAAISVAGSALLLMWLGGKVFRVTILMTGKPPRLGELWRLLRAA